MCELLRNEGFPQATGGWMFERWALYRAERAAARTADDRHNYNNGGKQNV